jgi:hypothetical protein
MVPLASQLKNTVLTESHVSMTLKLVETLALAQLMRPPVNTHRDIEAEGNIVREFDPSSVNLE